MVEGIRQTQIWDGSPAVEGSGIESIRKLFSKNTCNGCHGAETGSVAFQHIANRHHPSRSVLTEFLKEDLIQRAARLNGIADSDLLTQLVQEKSRPVH